MAKSLKSFGKFVNKVGSLLGSRDEAQPMNNSASGGKESLAIETSESIMPESFQAEVNSSVPPSPLMIDEEPLSLSSFGKTELAAHEKPSTYAGGDEAELLTLPDDGLQVTKKHSVAVTTPLNRLASADAEFDSTFDKLFPQEAQSFGSKDVLMKSTNYSSAGSPSEADAENDLLDLDSENAEVANPTAPSDGTDDAVLDLDLLLEDGTDSPASETDRNTTAERATRVAVFPAPKQTEAQTTTSKIMLDQLAPEVIDEIARRAAAHLSEQVIREIAWEVVPELAERLIRRRLEEMNDKRI